MAEQAGRLRRRPAYFRLLAGILLSYVLIISIGDGSGGAPVRIALLGYLVYTAARIRARWSITAWLIAISGVLLVLTAVAALVGSAQLRSGVVGGGSFVLAGVTIFTIGSSLRARWLVDTATVLGVLCIYLLLALLFASLHQVLSAFISPYVNGVSGLPTASDLLYFSVITMATVGFGDIVPVAETARAVTVLEALTGQLYLVSVVAAVVGGWQGRRPQDRGGEPD
ncbi:MAG TPA: ion channel [Micromonosporaceae bacterium]